MSESHIYTVAEINQEVRDLLFENFSHVSVRGEISGLKSYASGHWYFTLKDPDSEIRCAMFRNRNRLVTFSPQDGDAVRVSARVDLYVQRGSYQLVVEDMEPEGRGALLRKLEELKARLKAEGLFDPERKQPLPAYPTTIGVITSSDGAALRDVARALRRRWPIARLLVYPSLVQGDGAPAALVRALGLAAQDNRCDTLILARGGGSLEDLLAFSDGAVVRAAAACPIPLIAGVGHETDTPLVDFAADVRAATPTAAAELASPQADDLEQQARGLLLRMKHLLDQRFERIGDHLERHRDRLDRAHPAARIQAHQQRLDEVSDGLARALQSRLERRGHQLDLSEGRLLAASPKSRLVELAQSLEQTHWRLRKAIRQLHRGWAIRLQQASGTLDAVSPLRTLKRGYSIATLDTPEGPRLIRETKQARQGDTFDLQVTDGSISAQVTGVDPKAAENKSAK